MTDELYPSIMTDQEREAHLAELYPIYRPNRRTVPQESIKPAPQDENVRLTVEEIPNETGEQDFSEDLSEDSPDAEPNWEERKRLEESFSLVEAVMAYPRKKRIRETDEQRFARLLSETLGGSQPQ